MKPINADTWTRLGLLGLAAVMGLGLTLVAVTAQGQPDFEASHKQAPAYAKQGDVITYTILVENRGDPAQSVVLSDELPSGVSLIPDSCHYVIGGVPQTCPSLHQIWSIPTFGTGTRVTTSFTVRVTTDTVHHPLVNRAHLQWQGGQMTRSSTTTVLSQVPDFTASEKSAEPQMVAVGDVITYTITAANAGDPVTGVVLSEVLPGGVDFIADSCSYRTSFGQQTGGEPCTAPPELWRLETPFVSGGTVTTTFNVAVTDVPTTGVWVNRASLSWDVIEEEMVVTTTRKHAVLLPLVMQRYPPVPQSASVTIADGEQTVHQRPVTLTLYADFPLRKDEVTSMRLRSDGQAWGEWMPYTTTMPYTLTSDASELNTVYAAFRGSKGGVSVASDRVYLMLNGDFEGGAFAPWEHGGELHQVITTTQPHSGTQAALLGDPGYSNESVPAGSAWAYQTIKVPATGDPQLTFWYRIFSYDVMWSDFHESFYDYFDATIQDQDGDTLKTMLRDGYQGVWEADTLQDLGWRQWSYDLSAYKGQAVRIHFANFNTPGTTGDPGLNTYTYVDDVRMEGDW